MEEFSAGNSTIHKLDPRVKIVAAVFFSVVVALNDSLAASAAALLFPVLLIIAAHLSLRRVALRLAAVNGFMLLFWLTIPFTAPGETIFSIGSLSISREGLRHALMLTLKSNAILMAVMALPGTSPVFDLAHALSHMGVPDKLVHMFFLCFRYVHVIRDEYLKLVKAMKIRGFKPSTNAHTYRAYAYLVGMLLVRSFDRSQRILAAMRCRGFRGKLYILHHYNMKTNDYFIAGASIAFSAALMIIR
jgi:cobalt/nickel transport system permease protein